MTLPRAHYLLLGAWAAAAILVGSVLVSFHQPYLLPDHKISSLATRKTGWRALHLLSAECPCSRKVSQHLALHGPLKNLTEEVIFIGATDPFGNKAHLEAEAFLVKTLLTEDLDSFGVKGVPLLIFLSPTGDIAYMGGYGAATGRERTDALHLSAPAV
jgi:hypothetical protein